MSPLALEQPGKWRTPLALAVALLVLAPALVLVGGFGAEARALDAVFLRALSLSIGLAVAVAALAFALGWPVGVLAGVFAFPARRALLALLAVPLLVPSFITALGFARWRLDGFAGALLSFAATAVPLVVLVTVAALRGITRSQADAARVAGGEGHLARLAARSVWPTSLLTALLAGALTLSDAGPGQIFGVRGAAGEILVSFSAQYDFAHAARQCLALALVAAVVALPVVLFLAPRLDAALLARDTLAMEPVKSRAAAWVAPLMLAALVAMCFGVPLLGMVLAVTRRFPAAQAWQEVSRTLPGTFGFAIGAAAVALLLGGALTLSAGRNRSRQVVVLALALLVVALPPAFTALGLLHLGTHAPASADWLLRSGLTPGLALGARVFPIALLLGLRRWGAMPPSWADAAAGCGLSLSTYLRKVVLPWLTPAAMVAGVVAALLATAEIGTVLLLHPPGLDSLPLAIFTVMANASESLVAALCLFYLGGATLCALGLGLWKR